MSASHFPALGALALQTANALARYERHVRTLAATWLDMDLYNIVSGEIDEIRRYCAALPDVGVPWSALLVSHAELIHALWYGDQRDSTAPANAVAGRLDEHLACIDSLARRCMRIAERPGTGRDRGAA
jgi:hypothetical protein